MDKIIELYELAEDLCKSESYESAAATYEQALALLDGADAESRRTVIANKVLAIYFKLGKYEQAAPYCKMLGRPIPYEHMDKTAQLRCATLHDVDTLLQKLSQDFAWSLWKALAQSPAKNVCISPVSLQMAMLMVGSGARGNTRQEIESALGVEASDVDKWNKYVDWLFSLDRMPPQGTGATMDATAFESWRSRNASQLAQLQIANAIWSTVDARLKPEFIDYLESKCDAVAGRVDFRSPNAVAEINRWASERTHGKIAQIFSSLDPDTAAVLTNAVYFFCMWDKQFDPSDTRSEPFFLASGGSTPVMMMKGIQKSEFLQTPELQCASLRYLDPRYCMYVFLPAVGHDFKSVLNWLTTRTDWQKHMRAAELHLSMPRFTFEWSGSMTAALSKMGIIQAFTDNADFGNMSFEILKINEVVQKTFVKVDEKGTEAAAVTAVVIGWGAAPPPVVEMKLDRPFMFLIVQTATMLPIFMGHVANPNDR
jgi:serpin B